MTSNSSDIKNFTRGGQITLHNLRMFTQIMDKVILIVVIITLIASLFSAFEMTSEYERYVSGQYLWSISLPILDKRVKTNFIQPDGSTVNVKYEDIAESALVKAVLSNVKKKLLYSLIIGSIFGLVSFFIIMKWLQWRGNKQAENKKLRGGEISDISTINNEIAITKNISDIKLANLSLPKDFESQHILIHGTTGSGKSVCIREFLDQIKKRGDKAIIYDKGCDYIRYYLREKEDILLNPLDERTASWHLWNECRDSADYDSLAAALMPLPPGTNDPFWINAARTIFSAAARQMQPNPERSIKLLLKALLHADLNTMGNFLKGTEAETLVSEKIEKTAISIKSVLTTYLKSLQYVKDTPDGFSIRKWIQDDDKNNWLFISSLSDRHETLKPLISMWLDIAANSLMSLTPSNTRRIWMIFDELPSLQRLPYLPEAFAESRKFGGCFIAGMQSISQLRKIYGTHAAEEISNLCNTRIFFRDPSFESANWASRELGENESEEMKENISYGESAMRSGISLSNQRLQKQIITASEIMQLNNLEAYIRLPGRLPITKIKLDYKMISQVNKAFIQAITDSR